MKPIVRVLTGLKPEHEKAMLAAGDTEKRRYQRYHRGSGMLDLVPELTSSRNSRSDIAMNYMIHPVTHQILSSISVKEPIPFEVENIKK
jgi:hypothetical protein